MCLYNLWIYSENLLGDKIGTALLLPLKRSCFMVQWAEVVILEHIPLRTVPGRVFFPKFSSNSCKVWPVPCSGPWLFLALLSSSPWIWFSRSECQNMVFLLCSHPNNFHGVKWNHKDKLGMMMLHLKSIWLLLFTELELTLLLFMPKLWVPSYLIPVLLTYISASVLVFLPHGKLNIRLSGGRQLGV